ncbi:thioesterase family protein [Parasphingorhabdus pacifica]
MSANVLHRRVLPEWIDYNGHLSEAYYVLVFGFATDALMERIGIDERYRAETGCSLYTVEAHVRYLAEVPPNSELIVTTRLVGSGPKKLRICHEMTVADTLVATEEILAVHVGVERAVEFSGQVVEQIENVLESPPEWAGRSIAQPTPRATRESDTGT